MRLVGRSVANIVDSIQNFAQFPRGDFTQTPNSMNKLGRSLAVFNWASQKAEKDLAHTITKEKLRDHYNILDEVGRGAFGIVKKCERKKDKAAFAIKVILYKDSKLLNDIKREVEMMRRLNHEHLVTLYEDYECAGSYGMVMDYIAGGELFERIIEKEYLEEKEAAQYLRQLIEGLQYMHNKNIVHLDIKPENILCVDAKSNRVKLIDFGLARELKPGEVTRCALGTPDFVAPEAISFNEIKLQTDMWSTGVLTYVLLSGIMPFGGDTDNETLCNISNVDWEFDEDSFEEISPDARDFIEKLLTLKPDDRLSSADALEHPWMKANEERGGKINTKRHRTFLARRRWKKSVHVVMAVTKLCRLLQISSNGRSGSGTNVHMDAASSLQGTATFDSNPDTNPQSTSNPDNDPNPGSGHIHNCSNQDLSDNANSKPNPEIKSSLQHINNANTNGPITTAMENKRIQGDTKSAGVPVHVKGDGDSKKSNDATAVEPVSPPTNNKAQKQNAPDNKLVKSLSFSDSNDNGQKIMWKVLK